MKKYDFVRKRNKKKIRNSNLLLFVRNGKNTCTHALEVKKAFFLFSKKYIQKRDNELYSSKFS